MVRVPKVVFLTACVVAALYAGFGVRDSLREGASVAAALHGFTAIVWAAQCLVYVWRDEDD